MAKSIDERISESRLLLGNPYAYLDENGGFSAMPLADETHCASAEAIRMSRRKLQDPYAHLDDLDGFTAVTPSVEMSFRAESACRGRFARLTQNKFGHGRYSIADIEAKATRLQRLIWLDREAIWANTPPTDPLIALDPAIAAQLLGYDFDLEEGLGSHMINGQHVEVAGIIDDSSRQIRVSRRFPREVQRFTAAHELGHAMLHEARGLHRDRPLDGSTVAPDPIETEANRFASFFLMPEKLLRQRFQQFFRCEQFELNQATLFALSRGGSIDPNKLQTRRDLSRMLANAENYNELRFHSLARQFSVSTETMAIRLEELQLLSEF